MQGLLPVDKVPALERKNNFPRSCNSDRHATARRRCIQIRRLCWCRISRCPACYLGQCTCADGCENRKGMQCLLAAPIDASWKSLETTGQFNTASGIWCLSHKRTRSLFHENANCVLVISIFFDLVAIVTPEYRIELLCLDVALVLHSFEQEAWARILMSWSKTRSVDERTLISREDLRFEITNFVRTSDPACGSFVDVFIELTDLKSPGGSSWAIRGVRFGKADRDKSRSALATIVERMQTKFRVSEEVKDPAGKRARSTGHRNTLIV